MPVTPRSKNSDGDRESGARSRKQATAKADKSRTKMDEGAPPAVAEGAEKSSPPASPTSPTKKLTVTSALTCPFRFTKTSFLLFTDKTFQPHRMVGLFYLLQFATAVYKEFMGRPDPLLFVTMPVTGCLQSCIASLTFTFLPRQKTDQAQGYYHTSRAMDYEVEYAVHTSRSPG